MSFVPTFAGGSAAAQTATDADMGITVSDSPDPVLTHHSLLYQVGVYNHGPSLATGVEVTTILPSGVRFEPSQSDPACTESDGIVTCSYSSWDANAGGTILITVIPSTPGVLQLTFTVTAAEPDPDLSNNSQTEDTVVVEPTEADVSINLPSSVDGYAGENIWLGVEVGNSGPATASGLTVTLEFPRGISPGSGDGRCTETDSGLSCSYSFGSLPPGSGSVAILGLTASEAGSYTLRGSVAAEQPDPVVSNNSDVTVVNANPAADLSAQIAESADPTSPGRALTYTVTIINHGPSPASAVILTESWSTTVPGDAQLLSFKTTQGQCVPTVGSSIDCQLGELASGANATVTLTLRPRGVGSVTNQTQVSAAEFDRDPANNADSETTTVGPT